MKVSINMKTVKICNPITEYTLIHDSEKNRSNDKLVGLIIQTYVFFFQSRTWKNDEFNTSILNSGPCKPQSPLCKDALTNWSFQQNIIFQEQKLDRKLIVFGFIHKY